MGGEEGEEEVGNARVLLLMNEMCPLHVLYTLQIRHILLHMLVHKFFAYLGTEAPHLDLPLYKERRSSALR